MSRSYAERRGAHRPSGLGPTSAIPWAVAAVAIVLIVGFATGWFGGSGEPTSSTVVVSPSASGTSSATTKGSASPSASASSSASQRVDRTVAVTVLNGTSRSGLAAAAATKLTSAGWSIRATGNHRSGGAPTTVYYGVADLQATAQAVAKDLGVSAAVQQSADFGARRVTVVLGTDFQP